MFVKRLLITLWHKRQIIKNYENTVYNVFLGQNSTITEYQKLNLLTDLFNSLQIGISEKNIILTKILELELFRICTF